MIYKDMLKQTEEFLDTIPVENYLQSYKDLSEVMKEIQRDYGDKIKDSPIFEGDVFNWISIDEFADYLRKKKNIHIYEDVVITYIIGRID